MHVDRTVVGFLDFVASRRQEGRTGDKKLTSFEKEDKIKFQMIPGQTSYRDR